jgi:hypothetical protein
MLTTPNSNLEADFLRLDTAIHLILTDAPDIQLSRTHVVAVQAGLCRFKYVTGQ